MSENGWSSFNNKSGQFCSIRTDKGDRMEYITSCLYHNDLIMINIISFVTNVHDRVQIEMSSRRLRYISRIAPWKFNSRQNRLSLTYKNLNCLISVEFGDVCFELPSLTFEIRREKLGVPTSQPEKLMCTLNGLAERFASDVLSVTLGGVDKKYKNRELANQQLIITDDLLQFINDYLGNLTNIKFQQCGIDVGAIKYLNSSECTFIGRTKELSFDTIWFDRTRTVADFAHILSPRLLRLRLMTFGIHSLGTHILFRLQEMRSTIEDIYLEIGTLTISDVTETCSFMIGINSCCRSLRIRLVCDCPAVNELIFAMRILVSLDKITELRIDIVTRTRKECEDMGYILANLGKLAILHKLECGFWKNISVSQSFIFGLRQCHSLKELSLRKIFTTPVILMEILESIPLSVHTLELWQLDIDDRMVNLICHKLPHLRNLSLAKLPKLSSSGIHKLLYSLCLLESFYCTIPVSSLLLRPLTNVQLLPRLENVTMVTTTNTPGAFERLLKPHFHIVQCSDYLYNRRWCYIKFSNRKPPDLLVIPLMEDDFTKFSVSTSRWNALQKTILSMKAENVEWNDVSLLTAS